MPFLCQILECTSALNQNPATTPLSMKISITTIRYNTTSAHTLEILDAPLVLSNTSEHIQVVQTPNPQIKLNMIRGKTNRGVCMVATRRTKGICLIESLLNVGCRNGSAAPKGNVVGFWSTKRDAIPKKKTWFHLLFQSAPKGVDYYFISHARAHVHTHPTALRR